MPLARTSTERCCAGDREAFEVFMTRHEAALLRFCATLAPAAAEDAMQEAFLVAWRRAATFRGEGSARSWLFTIARRWIGRSARWPPPAPLGSGASIEELALQAGWGRARAPEDWAARLHDRLLLEAAFERLAPRDREVLLLRDLEGLSAAEAAAVLGIEVRALKSRLHRARLRLTALVAGGTTA